MTQSFLNVSLLRQALARHPCLDVELNPVLRGAHDDGTEASAVANALGQYCFLPRHIAELLTLGANRIGRAWPKVYEELRRNVREEMGDKTFGQPHFHILKACVKRELGLDLDRVEEGAASATFLGELTRRLTQEERPEVAGIIAALEDSATPELEVVARIIDRFAVLAGLGHVPIDLELLVSDSHLEAIWKRSRNGFNLEDFFALHILFFESGHSDGLAKAVAHYLTTPGYFDRFLCAYEGTLRAMGRWWEGMAAEAGLKT